MKTAMLAKPQSEAQAVLARLLMKDREARFANAGGTIQALERCREQIARGQGDAGGGLMVPRESIDATTDLPGLSAATRPRPRRWLPVGVGVILLSMLLGWLLWKRADQPRAAACPSRA